VLLGNERFRPVGLAAAPDGSLFISDWVDKSYPIHGKGRVWRLSAKNPPLAANKIEKAALPQLNANLGSITVPAALQSADPFVRQAAIVATQDDLAATDLAAFAKMHNPLERLAIAIAKRRSGQPERQNIITLLLKDPDADLRLNATVWIGEQQLTEYRAAVEQMLANGPMNRQLFEASLACLDRLTNGPARDPKAETAADLFSVRLLRDSTAEVSVRRFALRTLRPDHSSLTSEMLAMLLNDSQPSIRLEAIRTIRERPLGERATQLREIATDELRATQERCEAIIGLSPGNDEDRTLLLELAEGQNREVADESLRALRGFDLTENERQRLTQQLAMLQPPHKELVERLLRKNPPRNLPSHQDMAAWLSLAVGEGNERAGDRIFYHPRVGSCFRCHEFEGRGYTVGPDLSTVSRGMTRERLVQSIVDPSREIAPQFASYTILTHAGEVLTGIHIGDEVDGRMRFADQTGRVFHVHPNDIDRRQPSSQSIMPEGLADNLTPQEVRDLLAFLLRKND
jgi:putative heme-binding domain-containing protein